MKFSRYIKQLSVFQGALFRQNEKKNILSQYSKIFWKKPSNLGEIKIATLGL
jgi:hypothetical protein